MYKYKLEYPLKQNEQQYKGYPNAWKRKQYPQNGKKKCEVQRHYAWKYFQNFQLPKEKYTISSEGWGIMKNHSGSPTKAYVYMNKLHLTIIPKPFLGIRQQRYKSPWMKKNTTNS